MFKPFLNVKNPKKCHAIMINTATWAQQYLKKKHLYIQKWNLKLYYTRRKPYANCVQKFR